MFWGTALPVEGSADHRTEGYSLYSSLDKNKHLTLAVQGSPQQDKQKNANVWFGDISCKTEVILTRFVYLYDLLALVMVSIEAIILLFWKSQSDIFIQLEYN